MKIRNGFVSNSSSSSYVLIIKKSEYDKAKKDIRKEVIDYFEKFIEKQIFLGEELVILQNYSDMSGGTREYDETGPEFIDQEQKEFEDYDNWNLDCLLSCLMLKLPEGSYTSFSQDW